MWRVAMPRRQIHVEVIAECGRGIELDGTSQEFLIRLGEHQRDGLGDQIVLGFEVGVEGAVSEAGLGHDSGYTDAVRTDGANGRGRFGQYSLPGSLLVVTFVAHARVLESVCVGGYRGTAPR